MSKIPAKMRILTCALCETQIAPEDLSLAFCVGVMPGSPAWGITEPLRTHWWVYCHANSEELAALRVRLDAACGVLMDSLSLRRPRPDGPREDDLV